MSQRPQDQGDRLVFRSGMPTNCGTSAHGHAGASWCLGPQLPPPRATPRVPKRDTW